MEQLLDICLTIPVAPCELGLEGIDPIEHAAPEVRDLVFQGLELGGDGLELRVAELEKTS